METSSTSTKDGNASNGHEVIVVADINKSTMPTTINDAHHELSKSKSAKKCKLLVDQSILQTSANGLRELFDELNKFVMKAVHTVVANFCKPTNEKEELEFLFLKAEACNCTANLMETMISLSQQESKNVDLKADDDTTTFVISGKTYKTFCLGTLIQSGLVRLIGNNAASNINQNLISQIDSSLKLEDVLHASSIVKHILSHNGLVSERVPTISKDLQNLFRILAPSYASDSNYGAIQKIAYTMLFAVFMNLQLLKSYGPRLLATSIIGVAKAFSSSSPDSTELNNLLEALKTVEGQEIEGRFNQEVTMDNLKACMQSVDSFWSRVSQPMRMSNQSKPSSASSSPNPKGVVGRSISNISNNIMSNIGSEQPSITTPSKPDFMAMNTSSGNNNNVSQEKIKLQKDNRGLSYPSGASTKQPLHHSQSWPVQSQANATPQVTVFKSNINLNLKWIMTRGRKRTKAASNIPPLEPNQTNSTSQDKDHPGPVPNQNWTNFMEVRTPKAFVRNTNLNPFPSLVISVKDTVKNQNSPPPLEPATGSAPPAPAPPTNQKVPVARSSSSSSNLLGSIERTNSNQDFMVIDSDSEPDITEIGSNATPVDTNMFDDCICKIQLVRCDTNEMLHNGVEGETIKPISRNLLVNFHRVRLVGSTSFAGKKNSSPIHFKFCFTISNTKDGTKMAEVNSEPFLIVSHTKLLEDGTSQLSLIELIPDGAFTANHCPTKICILGSNLTHHHVVTIGNIFAKNLHLVSDEVLIVQFPILPPGRYPVQVHGPGKNPEISNTLTFTLFEPVTNLKLPPLMKPFGQTETVPIPSPSSGTMAGNKALKRDRPEAPRQASSSSPLVISSALKSQKVAPARKMTVAPTAPPQQAQPQPQHQAPAPVPSQQQAPVQPQQPPQPAQQPPPPAPTNTAQQPNSQTPQGMAQPVWPMYGQSPYPFFVPGMPMPMSMGVPMMMPYQPYPGMQFPAFQPPPGSASEANASQTQQGQTQLPSIQAAFPMQMAYYPMEAQQAQAPPADAVAPSAAVPTSVPSTDPIPPSDEPHSQHLQSSSDRLPSIQLPSISQLQTGIPFEPQQGQVPWFQGSSGFIPRPRT